MAIARAARGGCGAVSGVKAGRAWQRQPRTAEGAWVERAHCSSEGAGYHGVGDAGRAPLPWQGHDWPRLARDVHGDGGVGRAELLQPRRLGRGSHGGHDESAVARAARDSTAAGVWVEHACCNEVGRSLGVVGSGPAAARTRTAGYAAPRGRERVGGGGTSPRRAAVLVPECAVVRGRGRTWTQMGGGFRLRQRMRVDTQRRAPRAVKTNAQGRRGGNASQQQG